jgi:acyl-coenzyme A synthetase/AMP-(fatty) acid ligase
VAYVVPSPAARDADPEVILAQLGELVKENLSPFAAPREIVVVAGLPLTALGKVRRADLLGLEGPGARIG